jgi:rod shape-determining protein MreC
MSLIALLRRYRDRLLLVTLVAISLLLHNMDEELRFELARSLGAVFFAPVNGLVHLGEHVNRLEGENQILRERLMILADDRNRVEEYRKEAGRLRRLLGFRESASYSFLPAELLSFPLRFSDRNTLRIDRGRYDGIKSGMPVVSPEGLIGSVYTVYAKQALVMLLSSKNFAVSCRDRRSRVLGVFKWEPRRGFFVDRVDLGEDVKVGDHFMTSGLGSRFPEGFLLGQVIEVTTPPGALRKQITLAPAAPLQTLEDIFVVMQVSAEAPGFPLSISTGNGDREVD